MAATILVVDDEPDLLDMIRYSLERSRYRVHTADNGHEAIRLATSIEPDLIILDVMMPRMDGIETCRRLRTAEGERRTPILLLTALTDESEGIRGLEAGADEFVSKPLSPRQLLGRVRALLRRSGTANVGSPGVVRVHDLVVDPERCIVERRVDGRRERISLSRQQFQLLYFMAAQAGRAFSREHLIKAVWEDDVRIVPRTVDLLIRRLRSRLGESYFETVTGVGYRFREGSETPE